MTIMCLKLLIISKIRHMLDINHPQYTPVLTSLGIQQAIFKILFAIEEEPEERKLFEDIE